MKIQLQLQTHILNENTITNETKMDNRLTIAQMLLVTVDWHKTNWGQTVIVGLGLYLTNTGGLQPKRMSFQIQVQMEEEKKILFECKYKF